MMTLTLTQLLLLQGLAGLPIYLIAAVFQGIFLHQRGYPVGGVLATVALTIALSLLASVALWGRFFSQVDILMWGAVNLPAVVASIIVVPIITALIVIGFSDSRRG